MVTGDDLLPQLAQLQAAGHALENADGLPLAQAADEQGAYSERLEFCNAYLGAGPIVQALAQGADIVICGRVADAALFLAPAVHEFGWALDGPHYATQHNLDRLAQGLTMGHLLECSGQASGGNFGGLAWQDFPDLQQIGYPIAEIDADGGLMIGKAPGTGGRVSFDTLREQLLYEVHDPAAYLSPDLVLDMSHIRLQECGPDLVQVSGARGMPRPETAKVVAGISAGWMGQGMIAYSWPQAMQKARFAADAICERLRRMGVAERDMRVEFIGHDAILGAAGAPEAGPVAAPAHAPTEAADLLQQPREIWLRIAVRSARRAVADALPRLFPPLALSGPAFVAGRMGMQPATRLQKLWSSRLPHSCLQAQITLLEV